MDLLTTTKTPILNTKSLAKTRTLNAGTSELIPVACPGGVLWVLKHPAHADPKKKKKRRKKKKEKERKKEKEKEKERKEANDNEKYLSPSLPPLNGFKVSRHGPIRRTR